MFIGIDHSTKGTGLTILFSPTNYNTYLFKGKGKNNREKIGYIFKNTDEIIRKGHAAFTKKMGRKNEEILCFIEGGAFKAPGMLYTLGQLSGMILSTVESLGITWREVPPKSLKKFITGNGNASKQFVMDRIFEKYGVALKDDNIADSYALALMAYRFLNDKNNPYREEIEGVLKLRNYKKKGKKSLKYRRKKKEF